MVENFKYQSLKKAWEWHKLEYNEMKNRVAYKKMCSCFSYFAYHSMLTVVGKIYGSK